MAGEREELCVWVRTISGTEHWSDEQVGRFVDEAMYYAGDPRGRITAAVLTYWSEYGPAPTTQEPA